MHNQLKDRLFDTKDPSWSDVKDLIIHKGAFMACAVNKESGLIIGEFQLAASIGKVAQLHFSLHPELPLPDKVKVTREISKHLVRTAEISSLLGLTPFKHAKLLLKRAGWEYWGKLKGAVPSWSSSRDAFVLIYQE
jgi:hypothetical protein